MGAFDADLLLVSLRFAPLRPCVFALFFLPHRDFLSEGDLQVADLLGILISNLKTNIPEAGSESRAERHRHVGS